ncbi:cytochrome P450 [Panus rudis PR-1116 ss-1]|nr:cytochrome P450 [Panus rudis PR-1116 ss-1]
MELIAILLYLLLFLIPTVGLYNSWKTTKGLYAIPTIGYSTPILSTWTALGVVKHAREWIAEGYSKYKGGMYKIPLLDRWLVIVTTPSAIEELRRLPSDQVNFMGAASDTILMKHTFGPIVHEDPFHVGIIRAHLTKHLADMFPEMFEEVTTGFKELLPEIGNDWTPVVILPIAQKIIARASNRIFVGLPMCRHPGYIDLSIEHTVSVTKARKVMSGFPAFMRPLVAKWFSNAQKSVQLAIEYLGPMIEERLQKAREYGDEWTDKPNDMLQWIIDEALAKNQDINVIATLVLATDFVSIHTSSNSFTHALYHLAANPEFIQPLREEAEAITTAEGWTKFSIGKLRKIDSFLRESQRMNGIGTVTVMRKALRDFRLPNGVLVPKDTILGAPTECMHRDNEYYDNPEVFNPWRYYEMREDAEGVEGVKNQFVSTSTDYIAFGLGKHACPGRFFAANELKAMLAWVVLHYDIKFANEGVRPPNDFVFLQTYPAPGVEVLFRKRQN